MTDHRDVTSRAGPFDYDGRWFGLVADQHGTAGADRPTGQYHQHDGLVWAEFHAGGRLRSGRLLGRRNPDGTIDAGYCLLMVDGELVAGQLHSVPTVLADGRIRLADHWRRLDGGTGVSYIEELPQYPTQRKGDDNART